MASYLQSRTRYNLGTADNLGIDGVPVTFAPVFAILVNRAPGIPGLLYERYE